MITVQEKPKIKLEILTVPLMLLNGIIVIVCLFEFVNIKLLNQASEYHFGTEGPNNYETADLYIKMVLISWLAHVSLILFGFWALVKRIKWGIFIMLLLTIVTLAAHHFFNGKIS